MQTRRLGRFVGSASICPSTTTNDPCSPTTTCRPPAWHLTTHTSHHHHQPVTSPHPTATTRHVTSPTFSNRAGKTKTKQKKGSPATLFLFQVCFFPPHYPCLAHRTPVRQPHVCVVVRVFACPFFFSFLGSMNAWTSNCTCVRPTTTCRPPPISHTSQPPPAPTQTTNHTSPQTSNRARKTKKKGSSPRKANAGPRRPTAPNDGQRRPTRALQHNKQGSR